MKGIAEFAFGVFLLTLLIAWLSQAVIRGEGEVQEAVPAARQEAAPPAQAGALAQAGPTPEEVPGGPGRGDQPREELPPAVRLPAAREEAPRAREEDPGRLLDEALARLAESRRLLEGR